MDSRAKTILITGAGGFIGRRVVEAALSAGHDVRTLSRRDWIGRPFVLTGNRFLGAFPYEIPEKAFEGVHAVVHLAGTTGAEGEATARSVNVEGAKVLLRRSETAGVRKIVFISSQSAKPDAVSAYGKTKLEAEAIFRAGTLPATILRPGLVYGAGTHDIFNRMANIVRKLPVIPLLGGGRAVVQPIHVDDLAEAILRCLDPYAFNTRVLNLGAPEPIALRDFLQKIAVAMRGKRKPAVSIPVGPIIQVVSVFESLGVKLPVSKNNLQGLQKVERMETGPSLRELGLVLRPLGEGLRQSFHGTAGREGEGKAGLDRRAVNVALVGAGRIGLMHTVTTERQHGMRLTALVDKNPKAPKFLHGVGFPIAAYTSLGNAIAGGPLDAAIIATPPKYHLRLLKECAARGIPALVEKPLGRSAEELARFRSLLGKGKFQAGYLAPSYPQFREALGRLREGRFGAVTGFEAFSLQSLFPSARRWEANPKMSGGGVLINLGGHVLSWLFEAFGVPKRMHAQKKSVTSARVEDSMIIDLEYAGFAGRYCTSWCIGGFAQAENRLVIRTDQGHLYLSNTIASFVNREGRMEWFRHQVDFDPGFNFSPDYIGGAITSELNQLQRLVRAGEEPIMPLERGIQFEELLFSIYKSGRSTERFSPGGVGARWRKAEAEKESRKGAALDEEESASRAVGRTSGKTGRTARDKSGPALMLDVRQVALGPRLKRQVSGLDQRWDGFVATAAQAHRLMDAGVDTRNITVVAPDFMNYARQINSGNVVPFVKSLGIRSTVSMGIQAVRSAAAHKSVNFWAVGQSLLAADLALLPSDFDGTVILHSFLADLAAGLTRGDLIGALLRQMRRGARSAGVGVQTNIVKEMLNSLVYVEEPLQCLHFLASPGSGSVASALTHLKSSRRFEECRLVAETGAIPSPLYGHILKDAAGWLHGAEGLVVDAVCDPQVARFRHQTLARAWQAAFPGVPLPPAAL